VATFDPQQLQVRPGLRITGVVFLLLVAALMIAVSIPFFSAEKVSLKSCAGEHKVSSKLLCEVGNAMLSQLPARMQGPAEGLLHLVMAAILSFLSWLLAKPLRSRSHEKPS
jgi:hypothetical protein